MSTWRINTLFAIGIAITVFALFIVLRPPDLSPYHPFVGTWELERGQESSFQRVVLAPSQRVFVSNEIRGTYTISPSVMSLQINDITRNISFEVSNNRLYLYREREPVSVYKRIDNCWSPSLPNTCE
jgi:hypothetical protein